MLLAVKPVKPICFPQKISKEKLILCVAYQQKQLLCLADGISHADGRDYIYLPCISLVSRKIQLEKAFRKMTGSAGQ